MKPDAKDSTELAQALERLEITAEQLEQEALDQPRLFSFLASYYQTAFRQMLRAKARLEERQAHLGLVYRKQARQVKTRITEAQIRDLVVQSTSVMRYQKRFDLARAREAYAKLLLDAYKMRRDAIRTIADLRLRSGAHGPMVDEWTKQTEGRLRAERDALIQRRWSDEAEEEA